MLATGISWLMSCGQSVSSNRALIAIVSRTKGHPVHPRHSASCLSGMWPTCNSDRLLLSFLRLTTLIFQKATSHRSAWKGQRSLSVRSRVMILSRAVIVAAAANNISDCHCECHSGCDGFSATDKTCFLPPRDGSNEPENQSMMITQ